MSLNELPPQPKKCTSLVQRILKEIVEFSGWEILFQVLLYAFLIWGLYNLKIVYDFHTAPEWADVKKFSVYDFKFALAMTAFFLAYKNVCQIVFFTFVKNRLNPEKYPTDEEKNAKAKIVSVWIGSVIYYTVSSVSAFVLFKDQDFFPKMLGGKGEPSDMFKTMPDAPEIPNGMEFYMIQFGNHIHTLVDYIIYKRNDSKFWEMFLHHALAVFLIFYSYLTNNIAVGIMVLFTHDPCDIFFYFTRILSDLKYKLLPVKMAGYLIFLYCWIFFRLYAFPKAIVAASFQYIHKTGYNPMISATLFMTLMLTALVILHCYWFVFILRAGVMIIFKKSASGYNVYDKKNVEGKAS